MSAPDEKKQQSLVLDHTSKKYTVEQAQQPNKLHDLFGNYDALVADSIITEHDANDTQNAMTQKDERGKADHRAAGGHPRDAEKAWHRQERSAEVCEI